MGKLLIVLCMFLQAAEQPTNIPISSPVQLCCGQISSQDLGVTPQQIQAIPGRPGYYYEGTYTLTFTAKNYYPNYPGYFEVKLSFGTQELCDASGVATIQAAQVTVTCPVSNYIVIDRGLPSGGPVQGGSDLAVTWTVGGNGWPNWPIQFDSVSLTFTPKP